MHIFHTHKKNLLILVFVFLLVLMAFFSFYPRAASQNMAYQGRTWTVHSLNEEAVSPQANFSVVFDKNGNVGGVAGCNSFGGSYKHDAEGFRTIPPFISTKMMCLHEDVMEQERLFFQIMEKVTDLQVENGDLILSTGTGATLRLVLPR